MDPRLALYRIADEQRLDVPTTARLLSLAALDREPEGLSRGLPRAVAVVAAALGGFGVILWVAANWAALARPWRFGLLEGCVVACHLAAWRWPAVRPPFALAGWLATGGLLAFFGQTYQTGADAWELFAWWAVLGLPVAFAVRSDVLGAPLVLVISCAIALWVQTHTGRRWRFEAPDTAVYLIGWSAALALVIAAGSGTSRWSGAGPWTARSAATCATVLVAGGGIAALFGQGVGIGYALALLALAAAAAHSAVPRSFDLHALSAFALGLNALLIAGLAHALLRDANALNSIGRLLLIGAAAAALLAASVAGILALARRRAAADGTRA